MIEVFHLTEKALRTEAGRDVMCCYDNEKISALCLPVWQAEGYQKVASVETDDLEVAYHLTNNIDSSWSMEPHSSVTVLAPLHVIDGETYGRKSSSMGDVLLKDGEYFVVAAMGFQKVNLSPESIAYQTSHYLKS